jgi:hypothetical protein
MSEPHAIAKCALVLLLACFPLRIFAQDSPPAPDKAAPERVAVYAFGASEPSINKSLGSKLLAALVQSGTYAETSDPNTFQDELSKGGNDGIAHIAQTAKRHGADIVCAVSISEVFGAYSITARMVNTSDSKAFKTASIDRTIKSLDDLTVASKLLAAQLLYQPSSAAPVPVPTPASPSEPAKADPNAPLAFNPNAPLAFFATSATTPKASTASSTATSAAAPAASMPLSQALGSSSLPKGCVEDFTALFKKSSFSMSNFAKELPIAVAKTKLQLKSPFGKPKDSDMTSAGLTVGCIKTLPESPTEILSLLKDIALKAGLDFVAGTATDYAGNAAHAAKRGGRGKDKSTLSPGFRLGIIPFNRSSSLGLQIGTVLDIAVSDWFHLQPGIMYIQEEIMASHSVQIPFLLSLKLSALRINAGPHISTDNGFGISMGLGFDIGKFYIGTFHDFGLIYGYWRHRLGFNLGVKL